MKIYSVSEFRKEINELLEQVTVAIQGEVSDFHISQNRFVWFSLVDEKGAVLQCFTLTFQLGVPLEDGMEVRVLGSPTIFTKGQFVFRPRRIELVGDGTLRRAHELLKAKLEKEGLFDVVRKRALPRFPERIGLITSNDAAAYSDFVRILDNRWHGVTIVHANVAVQGQHATADIVAALRNINDTCADCDAIVLTRGGGSLEDLQAFNTEEVVRAIFASRIPVVCGVGHERDVTLADLVADVRASTPSNAAERIAPHRDDVVLAIDHMVHLCERPLQASLTTMKEDMVHALMTLENRARHHLDLCLDLLQQLATRFLQFEATVASLRQRADALTTLLSSLNPLNVLQRGYTLTLDDRGNVVSRVGALQPGQRITSRFRDGTAASIIDTIHHTP